MPKSPYKSIAALPLEGFVRLNTVLTVFPVSESHFLNGVKAGKFPKPIRLSPRVSVWKVEDIRALLQN